MALYLRQCWRQQPQGAVTINWNNPVTRGLICAWNAATPTRNYATNLSINDVNSGAFSYAKSRRGIVYRSESVGATSPVILLPTANVPTGEMSVTLHYRKTDAGLRQSSGWGTADYASDRFHAHMPWDNGTLYFDYGGATGNNRIEVSGLNYGDDTWTFQSTTSGLRAWQNGKLIGQNFAGLVTRVAGANPFRLLSGSGLTDLAESSFVFIHNRGLINTEIAALHENPYQIFRLRKQISFSLPTNYSRPVQDVYNPNNNTTGNASKIVGAGAVAQFLPRRWRQQPQGAVQVDWSNPLARGLDFLSDLRNPAAVRYWNSTGQQRSFSIPDSSLETSPPTSIASSAGVGVNLKHDWAKLTDVGVVDASNQTTPLTLFVLTRQVIDPFIGGPSRRGIVGRGLDGDGSGWNAMINWNHPASCFDAYSVYIDGGAAAYNVSGATSRLNKIAAVAAVFRPFQDIRLFVDGKNDGTYSSSTVGTFRTSTSGHNIGMAGRVPPNFQEGGYGDFFLHAAWTRALSDSEIAALSENPWQLFKPRKQIIYVPQTGWTRIP